MAIQIQPMVATDIQTIIRAVEKIAREAASMQNVGGQEDQVYVNTVPNADNLKEGQMVPYYDGVNYRMYTKLNGTVRNWTI